MARGSKKGQIGNTYGGHGQRYASLGIKENIRFRQRGILIVNSGLARSEYCHIRCSRRKRRSSFPPNGISGSSSSVTARKSTISTA